MNPWAIVAVVASVGKAYATYQSGMAQKAYYDSQADLARLQYKQKEIEAKEDGVKVLEETNKAIGTIIAKAASGGMLTNEGSALLATTLSLSSGAEDFNVAQINQELMQNLGIIEYTNLRNAGKQAKKAGIMGAIFGLGTDIGTIGSAGGFSKPPTTNTTTTFDIDQAGRIRGGI
jgi:hypothetical protein|tara:strand:- start:350 stop:874 length:525 start_codon:yes stop_codon:yes gene_type:complete